MVVPVRVPRDVFTEVARSSYHFSGKLTHVAAGDETASEGRVCDDPDAELYRGLKKSAGSSPAPKMEAEYPTWMTAMGWMTYPTKGGRRDFGDLGLPGPSQVRVRKSRDGVIAHLNLELAHLSSGVFNGDRGIGTMSA